LLHAALVTGLVALQLSGAVGFLAPARAAPGESCFTVSDGNATLYRYNYDRVPSFYETIGAVGVPAVDDEGDALFDVDDLAFDPTTGSLWGVANASGEDTLITINKATGAGIQSVGEFGPLDMEGPSWNDIGGLRRTTGAGAQLWDIDPSTAIASNPINLSPGADFESLGCYRVAGPLSNTITGTVFLDADVSGTFGAGDTGTAAHTVNLWRDVNGDGFLTVADIIATTTTNGAGFYSFDVGASGAFITEVVVATLPATGLSGFSPLPMPGRSKRQGRSHSPTTFPMGSRSSAHREPIGPARWPGRR
jgi:hypothetical protein